MTPFGVSIVAAFEKFRADVYLDAVGKPTIGYGHLIKAGEVFDKRLTKPEALALLEKDLDLAEAAVARHVQSLDLTKPWQFEALVSWTFNLGEGNLESSTMLRYYEEGRSDHEVAAQMIRWVHAGGRRLAGLVRRRHCEAVWYLGAPEDTVRYLAEL